MGNLLNNCVEMYDEHALRIVEANQLKAEQLRVARLEAEKLRVERLRVERLKAEQLRVREEQLKAESLRKEKLKLCLSKIDLHIRSNKKFDGKYSLPYIFRKYSTESKLNKLIKKVCNLYAMSYI
uniref:Uncharacterized protein n=1 Tax=viral metagenome TaxID=1070528 RepID=A0A6C0I0Z6_9ZZZZ